MVTSNDKEKTDRMLDEHQPYIAHSLRRGLGCIELREEDWVEDGETEKILVFSILTVQLFSLGGRILNLSNFPLLHSLSLRLPSDFDALSGSLETVVKLLTPTEPPCPPLHTITLVFDEVFYSTPHINDLEGAGILEKECCILYGKIDDILGDQQSDEGIPTSLTLKSSKGLPQEIVDKTKDLLQAEFPKLHRTGRLKIDFSIWGE